MSEEVRVRGIKNSNEDTYSPMPPMSLHGRRQIFTNEPITAANVVKILNEALQIHMKNRAEEVYLEKYIRGIQPVMDRVKVYHDEINNRVVVNIANQIVTFKTAEFAGEPIQYISRGNKKSVPKKVDKLNSLMLSEGKQSKDMDLAYKMFTYGVGYRLVLRDKAEGVANGELFDEAPFEIYTPDPRNTFVIRMNDVTKKVVAGVTYVYLDEANIQYTVYTPNEAYVLEGNAQSAGKLVSTTKHNFGAVTLIEYPCNSLYMSPIEVVHDLLNAISLVQSNRLDGIEQFIQAIMVFEGVDATREQIMEMKDLGAIKLPPSMDGHQPKVYYLNEQLDQSQTQTLVDDMYQTVLQIVGMPSQGNANTSDSSNNGAVIMKNGWWNAEARSLETEGMWKASETQFLKIALKICSESNALTNLMVSDVEPKFGRRSYEDLLVKTQSFASLRNAGCPSIQAFQFSKLSKDPESDAMKFDAYQQEREEELNQINGISTDYGSDETEDAPDDGADVDSESSSSESGSFGVCPVCNTRFKKKNGNQIYDRESCRKQAHQTRGMVR